MQIAVQLFNELEPDALSLDGATQVSTVGSTGTGDVARLPVLVGPSDAPEVVAHAELVNDADVAPLVVQTDLVNEEDAAWRGNGASCGPCSGPGPSQGVHGPGC